MKRFLNKSLILLILLTYLLLVFLQAGNLFMPEEIVFVKGAIAVVSTGLPIFTANVGNIEIGVWHPPMYIYALALSFKVFGVAEWSARLVNILFSLGTLAIVYFLAREVSDKSIVVLLSCFIFLLNPFVVQSSLLIDIDNTVLTFLMSLFVFAYVRFSKKKNLTASVFIVLGLLFGVTLWAKFGTPPVLIASIFIYHLARKEYGIALYRSSVIGITGILFFLMTWMMYTLSLKLPYLAPFEHNIGYLPTGGFDIIFLTRHLWGLKNIIFWMTPFLAVLLGIFMTGMRFKKNFAIVDYLFINGILIFIEYVIIGSAQALDFPKYLTPMMPFLSIVIANFIGDRDFEIKKNKELFVVAAFLASIYYIVILKDPFISDRIIFNSDSLYEIIKETGVTSILYIVPLPFVFLLLRDHNRRDRLILASLICLITFSIYIDLVQSTASYNTNYLYGQEGYDETVNYVRTIVRPNDTLITKEAIAYYTGAERWFPLPQNPKDFLDLTDREHIPYIILPKEGFYTAKKVSEVMRELERKYTLKAQFGDFSIYQIKD